MDARAALPQNCSKTRLRVSPKSENGTGVPDVSHESAMTGKLTAIVLPESFFSGLHRFVKALLQQKRQLLEPIPESSNCDFELKLGDGCPECDQCNPAMESQQL